MKKAGENMFIGQVGPNNHFSKIASLHQKINITPIIQNAYGKSVQKKTDTVVIGSTFMQSQSKTGVYKPNGHQMRGFEAISYTQATPDEKLQTELLPPSEKISYTESDALMNQYLKQSRIDGHFEGDTFVLDSDKPVTLILGSDVSNEALESFRQKLNENGLGEDIDWRGVRDDFVQIGRT